MSNVKASGAVPVDPLDDPSIATAVMQVVFDLARHALRERSDFLRRGFAMPDMPHEIEVHALLGVERVAVAPVRGSVTFSTDPAMQRGLDGDASEPAKELAVKLHAATPEDVKRLRLS